MTGIDGANEDLTSAAERAVARVVKARALHYARHPAALDALHPALSQAAPDRLIAISQRLIAREQGWRRRWLGFGGEVGPINLRAARLLGRCLRRKRGERGG